MDFETTVMIEEVLAQLPANYRNAIVLCHLEGHTSNEAAEILSVPRNTLNSRLVRGRELLRKRLVKQGISLSVGGLVSGVTSLGAAPTTVQAGLIQETSRAASLYAAGYPVVSAAATLAKTTIAKMIVAKLAMTAVLALTVSALLAVFLPPMAGLINSASDQIVLFDDFRDGSVNDGMPESWLPFQSTVLDVADNSLIVSGGAYAAALAANHSYFEISVLAQLRVLDGDFAGVSTRFTEGAPIDNYFGGLATDGTLILGGGTPEGVPVELGQVDTLLDPATKDAFIRLDASGTQLKLWAWPFDGEMPTEPLLVAQPSGCHRWHDCRLHREF